ncbi:uncharacterized protein TM35_000072790, partial [Trypanosoma theileri]
MYTSFHNPKDRDKGERQPNKRRNYKRHHMPFPTNSENRSSGIIFRRRPRGFHHNKFRTRTCRNYAMGLPCPFGENCAFSHGDAEPQAARVEEGE